MDLPDSDWGDFSCRRAVDSSSYYDEALGKNYKQNFILYKNVQLRKLAMF